MKIAIIILLVLGQTASLSQELHDWEDVNKTVSAFELLFEQKSPGHLKDISTDQFLDSKSFKSLSELMNKYSVNFGYSETRCIKDFQLISSPRRLVVTFVRDEQFFWYIEDAIVVGKKDTMIFPKKGFKPLAVEYNFSDFVTAARTAEIEKYSGLVAFGKLPPTFLKQFHIAKTPEATIVISNIILFDSTKIDQISYVILKNQPSLIHGKRGWLLDEYGSMEEYYSLHMKKDLFHDFLIDKTENGAKERMKWYDLKKESPFFFENVKKQ
jgi:hypothetical protein